jgi:LytR cell envelope-related transcriptional attenuator
MTTPPGDSTPPPEHGPVALVARLLSVQLLAVIGVATLIAVVFALAGWGTGDSVTAVPGETTSSAADPAGSGTASATAASSTPVTTPPATTTPVTTPASTPATTPPASSTAADLPKVDVLNQSAPGGSASAVADRVRSHGWVVGRVADFHGNVSTTTVYYPPGLRKEARDLAADLSGSPRVQAAFSTISDTHLTVILVD